MLNLDYSISVSCSSISPSVYASNGGLLYLSCLGVIYRFVWGRKSQALWVYFHFVRHLFLREETFVAASVLFCAT